MAHIFISYSRADSAFVEQIEALMRDAFPEHSFFIDRAIIGGQDWWARIEFELNHADIFLYLLSNDSLESDYCNEEFRIARNRGIACIPVIIRPKTKIDNAPKDIAVTIRKLNWVDLSQMFGDAKSITRLYAAINLYGKQHSSSQSSRTQSKPIDGVEQNSRIALQPLILGGIVIVAILIISVISVQFWLKMNTPSDIRATSTANTELEPTEAIQLSPSATLANETIGIVQSSNATLYMGPATHYDILQNLSVSEQVTVTGRTIVDNIIWYQVSYEHAGTVITGWLQENALSGQQFSVIFIDPRLIPPTPSPVPTNTPRPSVTPYPTLDALDGVYVPFREDFNDSVLPRAWNSWSNDLVVENGILSMTNEDWNGISTCCILDGTGALMLFQFSRGSEFIIELTSGQYPTRNYKAWGIQYFGNNVEARVSYFNTGIQYRYEQQPLRPEIWYFALIRLVGDGSLEVYVWERDNLTLYIMNIQKIPTTLHGDWVSEVWTAEINGTGIIYLDQYQRLDFPDGFVMPESPPHLTIP